LFADQNALVLSASSPAKKSRACGANPVKTIAAPCQPAAGARKVGSRHTPRSGRATMI
jgi:hypothetical protein